MSIEGQGHFFTFAKGLLYMKIKLAFLETTGKGVKLGHMKNALFGVLTIAMYSTPKIAFFR